MERKLRDAGKSTGIQSVVNTSTAGEIVVCVCVCVYHFNFLIFQMKHYSFHLVRKTNPLQTYSTWIQYVSWGLKKIYGNYCICLTEIEVVEGRLTFESRSTPACRQTSRTGTWRGVPCMCQSFTLTEELEQKKPKARVDRKYAMYRIAK